MSNAASDVGVRGATAGHAQMVSHPSVGSARQGSATLLEEESALHQRIVERDEAALLEYFDRGGHIVYCVALALTEDAVAAEDLTEGLFVDLWQAGGGRADGRALRARVGHRDRRRPMPCR